MFGLVIGTLCLFALIATLRHRHHPHFAHYGYAGGCAHGARHGHMSHRFGGTRFGRLRDALDLDAAQTDALREVQQKLHATRDRALDRVESTREALAEALRADTFDPSALNANLDGMLQSFDDGRKSVIEALGKAHASLRPDQRKRLGRLVNR